MTAIWLVVTLIISILNCLGAGYAWTESKLSGGLARLVAWSAAGMGAIGFTMLIGWAGLAVALGAGKISPEIAARGDALIFSLVALPILGFGLVLTIDAWAAWRKSRSLVDLAVAGYDTWAMAHNAYVVSRHLGGALGDAGKLFDGDGGDSDDKGSILALAIVVGAVAGGIIAAWLFVRLGRSWADDRMRQAVRERIAP